MPVGHDGARSLPGQGQRKKRFKGRRGAYGRWFRHFKVEKVEVVRFQRTLHFYPRRTRRVEYALAMRVRGSLWFLWRSDSGEIFLDCRLATEEEVASFEKRRQHAKKHKAFLTSLLDEEGHVKPPRPGMHPDLSGALESHVKPEIEALSSR